MLLLIDLVLPSKQQIGCRVDQNEYFVFLSPDFIGCKYNLLIMELSACVIVFKDLNISIMSCLVQVVL